MLKDPVKFKLLPIAVTSLLLLALLLWGFLELVGLYSWLHKREYESQEHFKGRLEALNMQTRTLGIALLAGTVGIASLGVSMARSRRIRILESELERAKIRREEIEELGLVAAGLAHETKNPLGIMRGLAQRIADGKADSGDMQKMALDIMEEADHTSSRLGDFLNYAGMRQPQAAPFNAKPFLERMASLLEEDFRSAEVKLSVKSDDLTLCADKEMLSQTVVNLLVNSLKSTARGGSVEASVRESGKAEAILRISDTGCGMSPEQARNMFKPYYSKRPGGCGLGLAIVRRMAEVSGWEIDVKTAPDKGTSISISGIRQESP